MDTNTNPSAPTNEWGGEKSSMGQSPPPPSYDNAILPYPPAGPAYPPQGQVITYFIDRIKCDLSYTQFYLNKCNLSILLFYIIDTY